MTLPAPYYDHGGITIYHGDCREILPELGKVDLVLTDPPYGIGLRADIHKGRPATNYLHKGSYLSYEDTEENLERIVVPAIIRALSIARRCAIFCAQTHIGKFPQYSALGGIYLPSGCGRTPRGFNNFQPILLYGLSPTIGDGCKPTVFTSTDKATFTTVHPCPKPERWMHFVIKMGSFPNELILDPFMGSGTTLRAAKDLGRRAIGVEIEERYCEIAAKRLGQEVFQW